MLTVIQFFFSHAQLECSKVISIKIYKKLLYRNLEFDLHTFFFVYFSLKERSLITFTISRGVFCRLDPLLSAENQFLAPHAMGIERKFRINLSR